MLIDWNKRVITSKVVFVGPPGAGKTTMLKKVFEMLGCPDALKALDTMTGRTLFFDFGNLTYMGNQWKVKVLMFSCNGIDFEAKERPNSLKYIDAIVFVLNSSALDLAPAVKELGYVREYFGENWSRVTTVFAANKSDLPFPVSDERLSSTFGVKPSEIFHTCAKSGAGIRELLTAVLTRMIPALDISKYKWAHDT